MNRAGVLRQDKEGRLESVFRVLLVVQHPAADAQDHRPMASDQGRKRRLVPAGGESVQQLLVGLLRRTATGRQLADVPKERVELCRGHMRCSPISGSLLYSSRRGRNPSRTCAKSARPKRPESMPPQLAGPHSFCLDVSQVVGFARLEDQTVKHLTDV